MEHSPRRLGQDWRIAWWRSDAGLETVEYALLTAVLLGAVIAAFPAIPTAFTEAYSAIADALANAMGG
jgi:Flp pilus assembly pilin Flp